MKFSGRKVSLVHLLAQYGAICIGLVYLLIGVVAMLSLLGLKDGGADEDSLLEFFLDFKFGVVFVWTIIGGLVGYIIWRIFEAIQDPYNFGNTFQGLVKRTGIGLSAIAYAVIVYSGIESLLGRNINGSGKEEQQLIIRRIFEWELGELLVGALGIITIVAAALEIKYIIVKDHEERLSLDKLSVTKRLLITFLAWYGHLARSIILFIIGYFFLKGAIISDPGEIGDSDTAFNFIGEVLIGKTIGHILFVIVAVGIMSYGLFMVAFGIYYKFKNG